MNDGFFRLCAAVPDVKVADCRYNRTQIEKMIRNAGSRHAAAVVFPELSLTGYTCGDLFKTRTLLQAAEEELATLLENTRTVPVLSFVGVPVPVGGALYNCAAVCFMGKLLGLVTKTNIPNYSEFYELRHFTPSPAQRRTVTFAGQTAPLGTGMVFDSDVPGLSFGAEICEDAWVADPPATRLAQNGATVLVNLSCSDETIGKAAYRRTLLSAASGRMLGAYVYADAGLGESTTDMIFAGHCLICENGSVLAESTLFSSGLTEADIDAERLVQERRRMNTWEDRDDPQTEHIAFAYPAGVLDALETTRVCAPYPFVPADSGELSTRCETILTMQATGLLSRLRHIHGKNAVIGLSGGLDSTLALLVTAEAFDRLGISRKGIHAISMPGFGTTGRTKNNARTLALELGVDFREISIHDAVAQHFRDIGHDPEIHDVTYENSQARERTQLLMDIANQCGGIVIGTGDLSELALGWATYNGDHMSMYGVNTSIPKTLVRHLVRYKAEHADPAVSEVLLDILDTPVSPELLPPVDGVISQKTEELVGPYELHDFFLYYFLRFGFTPGKIYRMACRSFAGSFEPAFIHRWLVTFFRRFFQQQFKRSCLPDGPKVGSVTLSPRGDFRMPSDASAALWLEEAENLAE